MKDVPTTYLQLAVLTGRSVILPASSICLQLGGQKVQTGTKSGPEPEWKQDFRIAVPPGAADLNVCILGEQGEVAGASSVSLGSVSGTRILTLQLRSPARVLIGEVCLVLFLAPPGGATGVTATSAARASTRTFRRKRLPATPGPKTVPSESDASTQASFSTNPNPDINANPNPNPNPNRNQPSRPSAGRRLLAMGGGILAVALALMAINKRARRSFFYEVKTGDSICSIGRCYGLSPDAVVEANIVVADDPDRIYPGDKLFLP